jgi:hypothetical protein
VEGSTTAAAGSQLGQSDRNCTGGQPRGETASRHQLGAPVR